MVIIRVEEYSKYAFLICAMCGEILKEDLRRVLGNERMARRAVQLAREAGILSERKTSLGKFVRLTKYGYGQLSKMPPLKAHYDVLTKKHTFANEPKAMQRRQSMSRSILTFLESEISVDNIRIDFDNRACRKKAPSAVNDTVLNPVIGKELFTGLDHVFITYEKESDVRLGDIDSFRSFAGDLAGSINFFPSNIVKRHRDIERSTAGNMNSTRTKGQVFGNGTSLAVYYMQKGPIQTPIQNELRYAEYMTDCFENIFGRAELQKLMEANRKGSALIIGGEDMLSSFILSEKERLMRNSVSSKSVLPSIYSRIHFIRFGSKCPVHVLDLQQEEKIVRELYLPSERQEAKKISAERHIKAVVTSKGKKMLSMPLLSLDIVKINDSISEILELGLPLHILCARDIEEQVRAVYENYEEAHIEVVDLKGADTYANLR